MISELEPPSINLSLNELRALPNEPPRMEARPSDLERTIANAQRRIVEAELLFADGDFLAAGTRLRSVLEKLVNALLHKHNRTSKGRGFAQAIELVISLALLDSPARRLLEPMADVGHMAAHDRPDLKPYQVQMLLVFVRHLVTAI